MCRFFATLLEPAPSIGTGPPPDSTSSAAILHEYDCQMDWLYQFRHGASRRIRRSPGAYGGS